jgi:hypothetical protein
VNSPSQRRSVNLDHLIGKFETLERDRDALVAILNERNAEKARLLDEQFVALSRVIAAASHRASDPYFGAAIGPDAIPD